MTPLLTPRAMFLPIGVRQAEPTVGAALDRERDRVAALVARRKAALAATGLRR